MDKIEFLYVENIINRIEGQVQQQLTFFMRVENVGCDKQVDIIWSGEGDAWLVLPAEFHSMQGADSEYWQARTSFILSEEQSLPGNIRFGLRYRVHSNEFWDNNFGDQYLSESDSGIKLTNKKLAQNIAFSNGLDDGQQDIQVTIAVDQFFNAKKVTIHWTVDHWKTIQKTSCHYERDYWNKTSQSNARNPNQYGAQMWSGNVNVGEAFSVEYIVCCENETYAIWENNEGVNYFCKRNQLKVLILNLHCYQEENQDEKFTQIAKVINELDIDLVCLQEVAEYWRDGEGDWESNSAKIINDRLSTPFHLHTDWSHLGFDKYREGAAILSRYPMSNHQARYVSDSHDIYDIHSRKVVMTQVQIPYIGALNVFSAHLSWLEDGFKEQFNRLHEWAEECRGDHTKATLLCGDFNITAGSEGYELVVNSNEYDDQFLAANKQGVFEQIFRVNDAHWRDLLADDYRIDYIFMNKNSALQVTSAQALFTDQDYGMVSDHCGYLMSFEPKLDSSENDEVNNGKS